VYGRKTWAMKMNGMRKLERANSTMLRSVCGLALRDKKLTAELMPGVVVWIVR